MPFSKGDAKITMIFKSNKFAGYNFGHYFLSKNIEMIKNYLIPKQGQRTF